MCIAPLHAGGNLPILPPQKQPPKKLDLRTIFAQIGERVCQVETLRGRCSGTLIEGNVVLVPFHSIALTKIKDLPDGRATFHIFPIKILCRDTSYTAKWRAAGNLDKSHYYDCCLFEIEDDDFTPTPPLPAHKEAPAPGDKVYYGGYPLTKDTPSFHKGTVSSVDAPEGGALCFDIDASVMPGNSGGPVFIQVDGVLKLTGLIFAELAAIDRGFVREREAIQERLSRGGMRVNGVDTNKTLSLLIDSVFDNLSTGIGKVMNIQHVEDLHSRDPLPTVPSPFHTGFPVMKTEHLPGKLGTDPVYLDWYHRRVKGKTLCGEILGAIYGAADQISKENEKILRTYYENNVLNNPKKGYKGFNPSERNKLEKLEDKIQSATQKAKKAHGAKWEKMLQNYLLNLPDKKERIEELLTSLKPPN